MKCAVTTDPGVAATAAEQAARHAYGRLLAILGSHTRDIALSEDVLADAFERALTHWPRDGVPDNPAAWLLTTARRRALDAWRHEAVRAGAAEALQAAADICGEPADHEAVPDERLRLLFVCAHPAIDVAARAPLMLQCVLGLDVQRMARAFLSSPAAMAQRLARAKNRIRHAGIAFEAPEASMLAARLRDVLDALYACYGTAWDAVDGAEPTQRLGSEALELTQLLCHLLPQEPEPYGLLALMLFCEARSPARRDELGQYVPLDCQDTSRWQPVLLSEAEAALHHARAMNRIGPYQIEAAIQSAHVQQRLSANVPPEALLTLYEALLNLRPSMGAAVGHGCALGRARGAAAGLEELDTLPASQVADYQPYWAARAHWLAEAERTDEAVQAYTRAIGLATQPALREHLRRQVQTLLNSQCGPNLCPSDHA